MLCENCGKNIATTFVEINTNGIVFRKNLCSECAKRYGALAPNKPIFAKDSFFSLYDNARQEKIICRKCGYDINEFLQTGYLGCPDCYKNFVLDVKREAFRIHGSQVHVGKKPMRRVIKK